MVIHNAIPLSLIVNTYKRLISENGYASCQLVADELRKIGIVTWSGNSPTRQAIWYRLSKDKEGRDLLKITRRRVGKDA